MNLPTIPGVEWRTAIADYVAAAAAAGHRPATVDLRRRYLMRFAAVTAAGPWAVTTHDVVEFLTAPGWAPETRRSARSAVAVFYRWAVRTGRVDVDPVARVDPVRVPPGVARPCPDDAYRFAITVASARDRLMLRLAGECGLRRAEIAGLHSRDLVGGVLYVTGKGGRTRTLPVSDSVRAELVATGGAQWTFPGPGGHLSADFVGRRIASYLPPGWTAHTLRHRFATRAYRATHDVYAVQRLLGHASATTTQRYVDVDDAALAAAIAAAA